MSVHGQLQIFIIREGRGLSFPRFFHFLITCDIVFFIVFYSWLAFTTNSWYRNDSGDYLGLWRTCTAGVIGACSPTDGSANTKYGVVQAFSIIGFLSQNAGFLLILLYMFRNNYRGNTELRVASAILLILSMIGWLIAVAIFGAEHTDDSDRLHYSYALAVCACGLGLFGGILMFIGGGGHRHVQTVVVTQ
ncbi:unnamed protein product [Candidula unifasciata]|uniref:Uncharacterized protein n=1 Tax=Candidula unifasciata TaxID=100452 RepID=A0A8S4A134_9EUPU|nr:unnamed protein product [Candidula unifasciata]